MRLFTGPHARLGVGGHPWGRFLACSMAIWQMCDSARAPLTPSIDLSSAPDRTSAEPLNPHCRRQRLGGRRLGDFAGASSTLESALSRDSSNWPEYPFGAPGRQRGLLRLWRACWCSAEPISCQSGRCTSCSFKLRRAS